jgi:hypothetical protein
MTTLESLVEAGLHKTLDHVSPGDVVGPEDVSKLSRDLTASEGAVYQSNEKSSPLVVGDEGLTFHVDVGRLFGIAGAILGVAMGPEKLNLGRVLSLLGAVSELHTVAHRVDEDEVKACLILLDQGKRESLCLHAMPFTDFQTGFLQLVQQNAHERFRKSLASLKTLKIIDVVKSGEQELVCLKQIVIIRRREIQTLGLDG